MAHKSLLSKNLLSMKFMQRTKEKIDVDEEVKATFGYDVDIDINGEGKPPVQIWPSEPSYGPCEDLRFGHMSFGGYNPEIEALMELKDPKKKEDKKADNTFDGMSIDPVEETPADQGGRVKKRKRNKYLRPVD